MSTIGVAVFQGAVVRGFVTDVSTPEIFRALSPELWHYIGNGRFDYADGDMHVVCTDWPGNTQDILRNPKATEMLFELLSGDEVVSLFNGLGDMAAMRDHLDRQFRTKHFK